MPRAGVGGTVRQGSLAAERAAKEGLEGLLTSKEEIIGRLEKAQADTEAELKRTAELQAQTAASW
eukprot:COSAG01_NODE_300_length_19226_cov_41.536519_15_plen_65_part_00